MYSWTRLRRILVVVLLLPVAHFAIVISWDLRDILNPAPTVWESEVSNIELRSNLDPAEGPPLVIIGGRQAKLWRGLEDTFFPMAVLNNGIGSANIDDVLYYFDRLVKPYQPQAVLMVPGPSDFIMRDDKSPDDYMLMLKGLSNHVTGLDGKPHFYVVTLNKWPRFPAYWGTVDTVNHLLETWADQQARVTLIDARRLFEQRGGLPVRAMFRADGINLNDWGYMQMSLLLRQQIDSDYPYQNQQPGS
jgi:hypothetical protein